VSRPDIRARLIGDERQPLAIIDHFAPNPEALRDAAAAARFGPAGHHYPGIRAPVPPSYLPSVQPALATVLREVFGHRTRMRLLDAGFSLVTTPPEALTVEQRLPHVDAVEPGRIALVHYLAPGEDSDGTAFHRHRATGFEALDAIRAPVYLARLNDELRRDGPPPTAYPYGDTPLFAEIDRVAPRFNRALVYRSASLHSGAIRPGAALSPDPLTGRLTITAFLAAD
jgi:hypothetical protein